MLGTGNQCGRFKAAPIALPKSFIRFTLGVVMLIGPDKSECSIKKVMRGQHHQYEPNSAIDDQNQQFLQPLADKGVP